LAGRIKQQSAQTLFCDCPNHGSQSHLSLHACSTDRVGTASAAVSAATCCSLLEFVAGRHGDTRPNGRQPESAIAPVPATSWLVAPACALVADRSLARKRSPKQRRSTGSPGACAERSLRWRRSTTQRLVANTEVLAWIQVEDGIGKRLSQRLKIGFAERTRLVSALTDGRRRRPFHARELAATSAFSGDLTAQDGLFPFFEGRIVFPYWSAETSFS